MGSQPCEEIECVFFPKLGTTYSSEGACLAALPVDCDPTCTTQFKIYCNNQICVQELGPPYQWYVKCWCCDS